MESRTANELVLSFVHPKVKLEDLQSNGRLFTDAEAEALIENFKAKREYYKKNPKRGEKGVEMNNAEKKQFGYRISKKDLNSRFSVIHFDDNYFAIYRGVQQGFHLGIGGYGYTKLAQNLRTGEWAVIKLCRMQYKDYFEFEILQKIGMGYGQVERIAGQGSYFLKSQGSLKTLNQNNIVMQLATGMKLNDYRDQQRQLSDVHLLHVCIKVLEAYQRLYQHKIIHGDLKLENIFYDPINDQATIIDYGVAKSKKLLNPRGQLILTAGYAAPELDPRNYGKHKKKYKYTVATDMYALGATLLYFLKGDESLNCTKLQNELVRRDVAAFGMRMCHVISGKRPTIEEAIEFFKSQKQALLNLTPEPIKKIALISLDEFRELWAAKKQAELPKPKPEPVLAVHKPDTLLSKGFSIVSGLFGSSVKNDRQEEILDQEDDHQRLVNTYESWLKSLQLFDQVWLIDSSMHDSLAYISIRRELESNQILVGNRCFITETSHLSSALRSVLQQIYHANYSKLNKLYFVSAKPELPDLASEFKGDIAMLPVGTEFKRDLVEQQLTEYAQDDIQTEMHTLLEGLRLLLSHQQNPVAINAVEECIRMLECNFKEGHLSSAYIYERLKQLRDLLEKLPTKNSTETPVRHNQSFFSNHEKSISGEKELDSVERQFRLWQESYI